MKQILMPQLGESLAEGVILRWLKRPGERIERDEAIVEISTDKVNAEVPSSAAGTISRLLVAEGDVVDIGAPIAEIDATFSDSAAQPGQVHPEATSSSTTIADRTKEPPGFISPIVRRLLERHSLEVSDIRGTGIGGRVTKDDVLHHLDRAKSRSGGSPVEKSSPPVQAPLSPLRRTIATHLSRAHQEIPAAWTMQEVDVTGLVRLRESRVPLFQAANGFRLTYVPFVLKATAAALRKMPILNSSWADDSIETHSNINLGLAVALDDGLLVPVVRNADRLSVSALARAVNDLSEKARGGRLSIEEVTGGTFTVNNTGAFGSIASVPIVNHPQAAILTMEAIVKRAVVLDGDAIAVRSMMNMCISFDHRIVDGITAGRFVSLVAAALREFGPDTSLDLE